MDKAWHKKYKTEIKKYNQDHYQTEIEALKKIIGTPLSDKFTMDMYIALINGRKITPKMLQAIRKIILRNSPEFRTKVTIEAKRLIPNKNFFGFSITAANPKRVKSFNTEEIIKVANFYSDKYTPTFFIERKYKELIDQLKKRVKNCYIPEEKSSGEFQKPILVTALGKLTKFNILINNGVSHMLSFSENKNFIFFNEQSKKWKPANNHTYVYDCNLNNTSIDKLSSDTIIEVLEKN